MTRNWTALAGVLALGVTLTEARHATATITVEYTSALGLTVENYSAQDLSIPIKNVITSGMNNYGVTAVQVYSSNPTGEDLPVLTFTGNVNGDYTVLLQGPLGANAARDWGGGVMPTSLTGARIAGAINGNLTGPVEAAGIHLTVLGTVQADVTQRQGGPAMTLVAGRIESSGSSRVKIRAFAGGIGVISREVPEPATTSLLDADISANGGSIDSITWHGDVRGSIQASDVTVTSANIFGMLYDVYAGSLRQLVVTGGTLGNMSGSPMPIKFTGLCQRITATGINADIENTQYTGGVVGLAYPNATVQRIAATSGDFKGSIRLLRFSDIGSSAADPGLRVSGKIDGNVTTNIVDLAVTANSIEPGRTVKTGRFTAGSSAVTLPANGLKGQIILNAQNAFSVSPFVPADAWTRPIVVDGITLSPSASGAYYATLSSALGGGAVGLVPFHLHDEDCKPPNTLAKITTPDAAGSGRQTVVAPDFEVGGTNAAIPVRMRFYGPVAIDEDEWAWNDAVVVECVPLPWITDPCNAVDWMNVTSGFLVRGPADTGHPREIGLSRVNASTSIGPGLYRVRFVAGVLKCDVKLTTTTDDDPEGPNVVLDNFATCGSTTKAFYFRVGADCDNDGTDDDIDQTLSGSCQVGCTDYNNDGVVSVADIFVFLVAWFNNCIPDAHGILPSGCTVSADFNNSGALTVADIFAFLTAWFASPGTC